MPPYKFRIRFSLPRGSRLDHAGDRILADFGGEIGPVELIGRSPDGAISTATDLILRGAGYPGKAAAAAAGECVRRGLLVAAVHARTGVEFGTEAPRGFLTEYGLELVKGQSGYDGQLLNDKKGLVVFDDSTGTRFVDVALGEATVSRPADAFLEVVGESATQAKHFSHKHILGLELYSAAHFESSGRARFLTLVSVVEVLAVRQRRTAEAIELIERMACSVSASGLAGPVRSSLASGLADLCSESIGAACRRLLSDVVNAAAAAAFKDWYDARSQLVHAGRTDHDIGSLIGDVDATIGELLLRYSSTAT